MTTGPAQPRRGAGNDLTDVAGVAVGHHQRRGRGWLTGTTVILPPTGTVGGVDVRGGAPGTRETDCLEPTRLVSRVDGICLTGGSAYGLVAADGVMDVLASRPQGHPVGPEPHHVVPIVPAAVLFDLAPSRFAHRPDADFGRRAALAARSRPFAQGNVGAGTGAHAGRLKGGIGSASVVTAGGVTVAALVALNSSGSPVNPRDGTLWGASRGVGDEFAHLRAPSRADLAAYHALVDSPLPANTALAVIATDAELTKPECTRLAGAGHDGLARAIDPIHLYSDGDVAFALATGARPVPTDDGIEHTRIAAVRFRELGVLAAAAADAVARAVVHAVLAATPAGGMPSYLGLLPSAAAPRAKLRG